MATIRRACIPVLIFSVLLMICVTVERAGAASAKVMLMMAGSLPAPHSASQSVLRFIKTVQSETGGDVTIRFFPGSELYADKDIPTAITQGACDMALTNFGTWSGVCPTLVALDLVGGVYKDFDHFNRAEDGPLGKVLAQDLETKGVHLLGYAALGESQGIVARKKQIEKPSDLKGLLVRGPTMGQQWFVEAFGAVPTFTSSSELYSALERGTIDAASSTIHSARQSKWYEAAPYVTWVMHSPGSPFGIVMNLNRWKKLSPKHQEILTRSWAGEMARNRQEAHQQQLDAWDFLTKDPKVKTYKVSDEAQKKEWDPVAYEFQLKKLHSMLGKEKTSQVLKAIASTK